MSAIKLIKEFFFKLLPTIDWFRLQVSIPIESISFKWSNKLPNKEVSSSSCILASLYEVSNMLFWTSFPIKLLEFRRLVFIRHSHVVNALFIRLWIREDTSWKHSWPPVELGTLMCSMKALVLWMQMGKQRGKQRGKIPSRLKSSIFLLLLFRWVTCGKQHIQRSKNTNLNYEFSLCFWVFLSLFLSISLHTNLLNNACTLSVPSPQIHFSFCFCFDEYPLYISQNQTKPTK